MISTCTVDDESKYCGDWEIRVVDFSDCDVVVDADAGERETLCSQLITWRSTGIMCLLLAVIGGGFVFAASCCQVLTCGCCGNSLDCISNVLFGLEVLLSIVTWSVAVSTLRLIRAEPPVTSSEYQWPFWLFLGSGTVMGALATWMADWAAEDSCLQGVWHCVTCHKRKERDKNEDERVVPLIGDV